MDVDEIFCDSPMLRDKIRRRGLSADDLGVRMHKLAKLATATVKAERAQGEANKKFVDHLAEFGTDAHDTFQEGLGKVAQLFADLNNFREMLCQQIELVFIEPLDAFATEIANKAKKSGHAYTGAIAVMDTATKKLANTPKSAAEDVQHAANQEVEVARAHFEKCGMQYISDLNEVRAKQDFAFLEHILTLIYSQEAFFRQGYELLKDQKVYLSDLANKVQAERERFKQEKTDTAKRMQTFSAGGSRPSVDIRAARVKNMEGYLYKRSTSIRKDWKKRYFAIRNGQLLYFHTGSDLKPVHAIDTVLCSAKKKADTDRRAVFEIITPQRTYILQAENDAEMEDWLAAIQASTADMLNRTDGRATLRTPIVGDGGECSGSDFHTGSGDDDTSGVPPAVVDVWSADDGNQICCDCGAVEPKWCSLNLGIIFCIHCSGVHRSLGVHISKVRSLELDKLDAVSLQLLKKIGNRRFNAVWEATLPHDHKKSGLSRVDVAHFIRFKYLDKRWLRPLDIDNIDEVEQALYDAVVRKDAMRCLYLLNHGVGANGKVKVQEGRTALHQAVRDGSLWLIELLYHHGADLNARDGSGLTPLHYAARENQPASAGLLLLRGAEAEYRDRTDQTPLELAARSMAADCVTLLRLAKLSKEEKEGGDRPTDGFAEDSSFSIAFKTFVDEACARDSSAAPRDVAPTPATRALPPIPGHHVPRGMMLSP